jgi:hypothetical protein
VLAEFDSKESAEKFTNSEDLKAKLQESGVQGQPEIHFIDEV